MKYIIMKYKKDGVWSSKLNASDEEYIYDSYEDAMIKLNELIQYINEYALRIESYPEEQID